MSASRTVPVAMLAAGLWLVPAASGGQSLGRLFTTPQERATLNDIRYQSRFQTPEPEPEPEVEVVVPAGEPEPSGPVVSRLTVNGVVRRTGGPGTVWVNGDQVERGGVTREGVRVQGATRGARNVRLQLPSGASSVELKPGQEIDVASGAVLEAYEKAEPGAAPSAFEAPAPAAAPATEGAPPRLSEQEREQLLDEVRRNLGSGGAAPAASPTSAPPGS